MAEAFAHANGIQLAYETFGDPNNPPLLLVMGLGAQMISWDEGFVALLVDSGYFVIRFDNRAAGRSTRFDNAPAPDLHAAVRGDHSSVAYYLNDMADDAAGLLDALGLNAAHLVGASMGGMIVQAMAIRHPDRVLSLASIMSTTGDRTVGQATPDAMAALTAPPATSREEAVEVGVITSRVIGSPGFPFDEERRRSLVGRAYDRGFNPPGTQRQMLAIVASGDRTPGLRQLRVPTVVIHGEADPLVTPSGGHATAAAIPGATLVLVPGMGHDLPRPAWPLLVEAITTNATRSL